MTQRRTEPPLAHPRAARLLLVGAGTSYVGDEVAAIALAIAVHDSGGSGLAVAAVVLAVLLPRVLLAPLLGWLIDVVDTRRLLVWVALAQGVLILALAAVPALPARLGLLLLVSVGGAVTPNALLALVPTVAGDAGQQRLAATVSTVSRGAGVAGPLAGALLVSATGVTGALLADAATSFLLAAAFSRLGVRRAATARVRDPRAALRGLEALWSDSVLRAVVGGLAVAIVFVGISYVATVFLAKDALGAGNAGVGALTAAYGAGMTIGCLACRRLAGTSLVPLATSAPAVAGVGFLVAATAPTLGVAATAYAVAGVATGAALTAMRAIVLARVPDRLLGRVFAAEGAVGAAGEVTALILGGVLVSTVGPRTALLVAGLGAFAPTLVLGLARALPTRRSSVFAKPAEVSAL